MWGYQSQFQILAQSAAEGIFNRLDKTLSPRVFLIGVLVEDKEDRYPICIEPEDYGYDLEILTSVKESAQHLEALDEERQILFSDPVAEENHKRWIKSRALKKAIEQVIDRQYESRKVVSFCSWPELVEGYRVSVVLQLDREAFNSHYSLVKDIVDDLHAATSLLDATVTEYLRECAKELDKPNPGDSFRTFDRDPVEIIRAAGKLLMYTPANAGGEPHGLHGLFDTCNTISSLRYEGAEGVGKMLIARRGHPNIKVSLSLTSPVQMREFRAVRKLLEMASSEMSLLSDSGYIYGLGQTVGVYDQRAEDLFSVNFAKHYTWELLHAERMLMRVIYGQPELLRMPIDKEKFKKDVHRIFPDIDSREVDRLWEVVVEATRQKHGTIVVVSSGAQTEAKRLEKQSTNIEPIQLTPEIVQMITAIDGAVLIDPTTTCYAVGVILDGLASNKGAPSR